MRDVLIGYEPTPQGEDALALGGLLSEVLAARPLIVTAIPYSSAAPAPDRDVLTIASRSPANGLIQIARDRAVSAIVIGSTHRGPAGRVVFGSTAERLLHGAPAPVGVAPRGFSRELSRHLDRIAVAYDGSAEARHALETGIELAERSRGSLSVLHVIEPPTTGYGAFEQALLAVEGDEGHNDETLADGLERVPAGVPAEGRSLHGTAAACLAAAAKDHDLLVMGSRGRGPLLSTALGSVSGPVARQAPCPILVTPRGGSPLRLAATASTPGEHGG